MQGRLYSAIWVVRSPLPKPAARHGVNVQQSLERYWRVESVLQAFGTEFVLLPE
jgi:hypothetical protein